MRIRNITVLLLIFSIINNCRAQTLSDTINLLYSKYFELIKPMGRLDSITTGIDNKYSNFNSLLKSNNDAIQKLTQKELFTLNTQIENRKNKITNSSKFIFSANASLNSIRLVGTLVDYFNAIASLNNPNDSTLGFSLSTEVKSILSTTIIKGKKKLNNTDTSRLIKFVDNIIRSPIIETVASAFPAINSIKSVVDLVVNTATRGNDIQLEDIVAMKKDLYLYMQHYSDLAKAQQEFSNKLNNIYSRKDALVLLLTSFVKEQITTLELANDSELKRDDTFSLTQLIGKYYSYELVGKKVGQIINRYSNNSDSILYDTHLFFPDYAINQEKFFRDEIDALSSEYILAFESYQNSMNEILNKSKKLGNEEDINNEIELLEKKLESVKKYLMMQLI